MNYICKCKKINFLKNEYTYWEDREVTSDELDIIDFLKNSNSYNYDSILHIGIGNSFFAKNFSYLYKLEYFFFALEASHNFLYILNKLYIELIIFMLLSF